MGAQQLPILSLERKEEPVSLLVYCLPAAETRLRGGTGTVAESSMWTGHHSIRSTEPSWDSHWLALLPDVGRLAFVS